MINYVEGRSACGRRHWGWRALVCLALIYCCQLASAVLAQGSAVAGAKTLVLRIGQAKTGAQFAECLTNESAAMLGTLLTMPMMMQNGLGGNKGASAHQKAEQAQMQALIRRYGLDKVQNKGPESKEWLHFASQGRRFLVELDQLQVRNGQAGIAKQSKSSIPSPDALRYTALSPTRVSLQDPKQPKAPPMQARLEDGQWRLALPMGSH